MKMWVESLPDLKELLMRTQPAECTHDPDMVFMYMNEIERLEKPGKAARGRVPLQTERMWKSMGSPPSIRSMKSQSPVHLPAITPRQKKTGGKVIKTSPSQLNLAKHRPVFVTVRGQVVNREQVIMMKQIFDQIDRSKDGSLSFEEFAANLSNRPTIQKWAYSLFRDYDANSSGSITFDEILVKTFRGVSQKDLSTMLQWVRGTLHTDRDAQLYMKLNLPTVTRTRTLTLNSAKEYQDLFDMYDVNKDGELSLAELKTGLGHMFSSKDIEAMFVKYDANKDQKISLYEFLRMMAPENSEFSHEVVKSFSHR